MDKRPTSSRELLDFFHAHTVHHPEQEEAKAIAMVACLESTGYTQTDIIADKPLVLLDEKWEWIKQAASRLQSDEPVQYVFNNAWFYGRSFYVEPGVLIPRQETEELVDLILREWESGSGRFLDVGTGSGCIAISLALGLPACGVVGIDVSELALSVAEKNRTRLDTRVDFDCVDILQDLPKGRFDVIVSNPPYVPGRERKDMLRTVSSYEPGLALFVPDHDPLLFYRRILGLVEVIMNPGGKVYFEIHESFGQDLKQLTIEMGFSNIRLIKDMNQKDRFLALQVNSSFLPRDP